MKVDLDEVYDAVVPWDLTLRIGGHDWRVRRLTNLEVRQLTRVDGVSEADVRQRLIGLFEEPYPAPIESIDWDRPRTAAVVAAVLAYFNGAIVGESSRRAAEAVVTARRAQRSTGEASSRP